MILTTEEERLWYVRYLALGLVSHMGITEPPVWVEKFLQYSPNLYVKSSLDSTKTTDVIEEVYKRLIYIGSRIISPSDLPEDERRYALAREIIIALGSSKHGRCLGLPQFILPYLPELQDYFARVLLAPDPMIIAYRKQGGEYRDFARSFLIPHRIAKIRWQETALL
jgi:hypothetical protein